MTDLYIIGGVMAALIVAFIVATCWPVLRCLDFQDEERE